ncbi:MAG: substrate-binding domain-containing protein, partial [Pseudomonadota bacterium]
HDVANPVYGEILRGAQEEAEHQNKALLLGDASVGTASNSRLAQMIGGGGVDGLILQAAGVRADDLIVQAARQQVPVVLLQAALDVDAHLVLLPDEQAAEIATTHLLALGHHRIGCLATAKNLTFTDGRLSGWRGAMDSRADDDLITYSGPTAAEGEDATRSLLERRPDLTGLVCFNIVSAIGALRAARALNLQVPHDLSIISIHDVKFSEDLRVPLSVVRMPLAEMGRIAIRTVSDPPEADKSTIRLQIAPELVLRKSTGPVGG